ncbi:uncharacterized protein LOC129773748 [Toxorhynchites rutilus septentrionalis]|uniref:uncharacterized protein LOC129773748 n=1 Tax=Toxorhynchites rutilus septentrionalis TaxID=329112 RepID=UPI002478D5D8|nr:uncharacterized protein LOC129773748 [Toxorhynchites rutilus septentrionalis]
MVCCDRCACWFHFVCVGVNEDVANRSWNCPDCSPAEDPAPQLPQSSTQPGNTREPSNLPAQPSPQLPILPPPGLSSVPPRQIPTPRPRTSRLGSVTPPTPLPRTPRPLDQLLPVVEVQEERATNHVAHIEADLLNELSADLRIQLLEEQEAIEQRYLLPEENMVRLQKCLRGKALEAVKCQLLHPSNLDQVLATLKMLFGRPEIIVHSLIQKVNNLPAPKADRLGTLVDFALAVRNMVATVQACELEEHLCNLTLLHSLTKRLPPMIRLNWATHRQSLRSVTLVEFSDWLYKLAEAANAVTMPQFSCVADNKYRRTRKEDGFLNTHAEAQKVKQFGSSNSCVVCKGSCVAVEKCKQFVSYSLSARWDALREHKLCRSCLTNHRGSCKSAKPCGKNGCEYKHNRLLHNDAKDKRDTPMANSSNHTNGQRPAVHDIESCNMHRGGSNYVLFQYIPIILYNQGIEIRTYAFLDSGSSLTLMEEGLAKQLHLSGEKHPLCLRWTADTCRYEMDATKCSLNVSGTLDGSSQHNLMEVYTVKDLKLPSQSLSAGKLSAKYAHLKGLPIESYNNVQPKLLIGVSNARVMQALDSREGMLDEPVAVKTRLGWTVYGTMMNSFLSSVVPHSFHICSHSLGSDENLHEAVKNYFTLDSLGIGSPQNQLLSKEDERALAKLHKVTTFQDGRYQVRLLWKYDDIRLPNNRTMALRRHHCLIKRMEREPMLAETPGKVRIVFYAAASFGGVSLNSVLMKGPDQLNALPPVLYKFRERLIGLGGDIAEMFHQLRMNPEDADSQRILWCANAQTTEPCDYVMQVVTFGATCSPSTALHVLKENASRFEIQYPVVVEAIFRRHYVDDMLTSVNTDEEAIKLANDVQHIHNQGGFLMRNWVSNSPVVLEALGVSPKHEKSLEMNAELAMEKVLGMWWSTTTDVFRYKLCTDRNQELLSGSKYPTKRDVLRTLMAIYDPLGLIAHYLMYLKVLLQEIWRAKTGWDDTIEHKHLEKWLLWLRILPELETVEVPRCYFRHEAGIDNATVELHTFVDASENGFAAVSFFRFEVDGHIECSLIGSKTRVAPIKFVSIPRLELQAAVVGARLAQTQTDARDIICWLQSDHRRYSQFVAFRVGEILETTNVNEWRWLGTKYNVADDGTKWKFRPDLRPTSRWFIGPPFLWKPKSEWPVSTLCGEVTSTEIRTSLLHHTEAKNEAVLQPDNYSSWQRLRRVIAFVQRFVGNIKRKQNSQPVNLGPLEHEELSAAEMFLFRQAQRDDGEELAAISVGNRQLNKKSRLYKQSPFIDDCGVMRIHSRLGECDFLDESDSHPIILPRDHKITRLVVANVHQRYHHQCHETCVNEVRKAFYIPRVRRVCNHVRRSCQMCKIFTARPMPPSMGPLPKARVAAFVRPFSSDCGTNFVGADEELKAAVANLDRDKLVTEFTTPTTSWIFNPPASPHMGGCWERLIQSIKKILVVIKPQRVTTEEVLRSYLIQVENIVNSRPLTHVPVDSCSSPALTPNHFLVGSSNGSKPLVPYKDCPLALQRSWKASDALANRFWQRWITEYLPTITRRTKWFNQVKPIAVGDVVIVVDPDLARSCWPKGRVVSVTTSSDGQVRSAVMQTASGLYNRPAVKLAVLDVGANDSRSDQGPTTGGDCCVHPVSDAAHNHTAR